MYTNSKHNSFDLIAYLIALELKKKTPLLLFLPSLSGTVEVEVVGLQMILSVPTPFSQFTIH